MSLRSSSLQQTPFRFYFSVLDVLKVPPELLIQYLCVWYVFLIIIFLLLCIRYSANQYKWKEKKNWRRKGRNVANSRICLSDVLNINQWVHLRPISFQTVSVLSLFLDHHGILWFQSTILESNMSDWTLLPIKNLFICSHKKEKSEEEVTCLWMWGWW